MSKPQKSDYKNLPLDPGEIILWEQKPEPSAYVKQRYGKLTVIGVVLLGFILFGIQDLLFREDAPKLDISTEDFLPVLMTFCLMGVIGGVMATSIFWGRNEARNTKFYLTDQKLIISRGVAPVQVQNYPPQKLTQLDIVNAKDGTGSLYFRDEKPLLYGGLYKKRIGFEGIRDPSTLFSLIHKAFYT